MKYLLLCGCLVFAAGCSSEPTNVVGDADAQALADYEAALAEADNMQASDAEK
ncbi:hypothetical protein LOC67_05570 [Stieleria sp. JC731]|uniref:hypothetical protein n=1 Tax=Pirellulaceae TaxID=2691357 RepID=UPI001E284DB0|nr:hypothetical protein [Stieleria sp. JC731]MCC9600023.1 hypothetical protein [Stieleria sp. JC731]